MSRQDQNDDVSDKLEIKLNENSSEFDDYIHESLQVHLHEHLDIKDGNKVVKKVFFPIREEGSSMQPNVDQFEDKVNKSMKMIQRNKRRA